MDDKMVHSNLEQGAIGEVLLPSGTLSSTLDFFVKRLGFRIDTIYPAEDPEVARISGHGLHLRLAPEGRDPGLIRLLCDDVGAADETQLIAPNGTRIELVEKDAPTPIPDLCPAFSLTRIDHGPPAGEGRAGLTYRDLIPDRQGGRFIASHITLPEGGPVSDWAHFHKIRFQIIFCRRGTAQLVYEDQGPPFTFSAGDCILQPPGIRHRVLETSSGFQVVEISCPALHETLADHEIVLPTGRFEPDRDFGGQVFRHSTAADQLWTSYDDGVFERQETGLAEASRGVTDAYVLRRRLTGRWSPQPHAGELLFNFVLDGSTILECQGERTLEGAAAFVIPAGERWALRDSSEDFTLLQVVVPARAA